MSTKINSLLIVLTFAFGIMLASTISAGSLVVFAQKNQTKPGAASSSSSSGNQTTTNVTPSGKQATRILTKQAFLLIRPLLQFKRRQNQLETYQFQVVIN